MDKTIERLAAVLDVGRVPDGATGADLCSALDAESAYRSKYAAHDERRDLARRLLAALGLVALPPELLTTRDQQEESNDRVTTLRSDARYLRGLAEDAPTEDDAAALRRIAAKVEALAAVVLPEVETNANGNVQSWRDLSGNSRDLVQADPAKMPSR